MRGFQRNVIILNKTGKPGLCPFCASANVKAEEYYYKRDDESGMDGSSVSFACSDCKNATHYDGSIDCKGKKDWMVDIPDGKMITHISYN